jgi:hypothetical protein
MNCGFMPGQRVVCVDDDFDRRAERISLGIMLPEKNAVYTIREVLIYLGQTCVRLEEIVNRPWPPDLVPEGEQAFKASRFRPVIETDISVFKKMLVNPPVLEDA